MPLSLCACRSCGASVLPRAGATSGPAGFTGGDAAVGGGGAGGGILDSCDGGVKWASSAETTPWNEPNAVPITSTDRSVTADTPAAVYGPCAASTMPAQGAPQLSVTVHCSVAARNDTAGGNCRPRPHSIPHRTGQSGVPNARCDGLR